MKDLDGEDDLIAWLRRRIPGPTLIGDDAAVLREQERWAVSTDPQIEGTHFPRGLDPRIIARRALAVSLSDLAATGADPAYAFVALAAPRDFDHRGFLDTLAKAAARYAIEIAGGDLSAHDAVCVVITVLGRQVSGRRWLSRREARAGDTLWLGGEIGRSAAGRHLLQAEGTALQGSTLLLPGLPLELRGPARRAVWRHLMPRPQLRLGAWLSTVPRVAAIDVSDGLARDVHRLCRSSQVGAELERGRLPIPDELPQLAGYTGRAAEALALHGGEDYVLAFTLPPGETPPDELACRRIGRLVATPEVTLIRDGRHEAIPPDGWDHLIDGGASGGRRPSRAC